MFVVDCNCKGQASGIVADYVYGPGSHILACGKTVKVNQGNPFDHCPAQAGIFMMIWVGAPVFVVQKAVLSHPVSVVPLVGSTDRDGDRLKGLWLPDPLLAD